MEGRGRKTISGDKFTFPSMTLLQTQDSEFEFRSVTPAESPNSPADHLFFNGRLLPHSFPVLQPTNTTIGTVYSRSTSRASSVSSKDSLVSSRSNSTNSRSSSSGSSARTSTSTEANYSDRQRRSLSYQSNRGGAAVVSRDNKYTILAQQYYESSQRWQFITPVPALNHQVSRRKRSAEVKEGPGRKKAEEEGPTGARSGLGRRFFRSFVSACKECHAIKPATRDRVLQGKT